MGALKIGRMKNGDKKVAQTVKFQELPDEDADFRANNDETQHTPLNDDAKEPVKKLFQLSKLTGGDEVSE